MIPSSTKFTNLKEYGEALNSLASQIPMEDTYGQPMAMDSTGEGYGFAFGELTYIDPTVYPRKYRPQQYEEVVFQNFINAPWATDIAYIAYDWAGKAEIHSGAEGPAPTVDVAYNKFEERIYLANISFKITQEEIRQTSYLGRGTSNNRITSAIEAVSRTQNAYAIFGSVEDGITGVLNKPTVPVVNATHGDWGNVATTAEQKTQDLQDAVAQFVENTGNADYPTDILMSWEKAADIAQMPRFPTNAMQTVLSWFEMNNGVMVLQGRPIRIRVLLGAETAGVGGVQRMIVMRRAPEVLQQYQPMPLRFLAPQFQGTAIHNIGECKFSPPIVRYPGSMLYVDGI